MNQFTITRQIDAPVEIVWSVLDDFGNIADWSSGVKRSSLTSEGPVGEGATRHCDFVPLGGVNERIEAYRPNERMAVNMYEIFKMPVSSAIADFNLASAGDGTVLTLNVDYTPNRLGRVARGTTEKQMRKGMSALAHDLERESERLASTITEGATDGTA